MSKYDLDYAAIAPVIVGLMNIPQPWVLSIDRTEWSYGKSRLNIFMLGLVHQGVAYPLVWKMLEKKGNSNSDERMDLLDTDSSRAGTEFRCRPSRNHFRLASGTPPGHPVLRFQEIFPLAQIA